MPGFGLVSSYHEAEAQTQAESETRSLASGNQRSLPICTHIRRPGIVPTASCYSYADWNRVTFVRDPSTRCSCRTGRHRIPSDRR